MITTIEVIIDNEIKVEKQKHYQNNNKIIKTATKIYCMFTCNNLTLKV